MRGVWIARRRATNGWNGTPAAGEHVFVVTHRPPTDWEHFGTAPFTFVDGVEQAIAAAKAFAGDRDVDVVGGQMGSQALKLSLERRAAPSVRIACGAGNGSNPGAYTALV